MHNPWRWLSLVLALATAALFLMREGRPLIFLDPLTLIGFLIMALGTGSAVLGIPRVAGGLREAFRSAPEEGRLRETLAAIRLLDRACLLTGFVLLTAGLLTLFANLGTPSAIGPSMALATLGSLYALVASRLVCYPLSLRLRRRLGEGFPTFREELVPNLVLLLFPLGCFLSLLILIFALSS